MKQIILIAVLTITLALIGFAGCNQTREAATAPATFTGNEHGNGGDNFPPDFGALWFSGTRVVKVCIDRDAKFPIPLPDAKRMIAQAFTTWKQYFQERVLNGQGSIVYSQPENDPAFAFSFQDKCDQSEDLKFYLGSSDEKTEKAKANYANPTAFAYRTSYDVKTGWGAGFIWMALSGVNFQWTAEPNLFLAMVLHELGHVFGCEHVGDSIMSADIVSLLQAGSVSSPEIADPYLTQIDRNREFVLNAAAAIRIAGYGNSDSCQLFLGRACRGSVRGNVQIISERQLNLQLHDGAGAFEIPISLEAGGSRFMNDAVAFKIYRDNGSSVVNYWVAAGTSSVDYGSIQTSTGKTVEVIVERNSQTNRIRVRYRDHGKLKDLFAAFRFV